jgi:hypothetical protein
MAIFVWIGIILTVAVICILLFSTLGNKGTTYSTLKECSNFTDSSTRCESRMTSEGMQWRVVSNHLAK